MNYMQQAEVASRTPLPDPRPTLSEVLALPKSDPMRFQLLYGSMIVGDNVVPCYRPDDQSCETCGMPGPIICTLGDRCENKLKMEGKEY